MGEDARRLHERLREALSSSRPREGVGAARSEGELIPPEGFDPARLETWPEAEGRLEYVDGRLLYLPPYGDLQQDTTSDIVLTLGAWVRASPAFVLGTNEAGMRRADATRAVGGVEKQWDLEPFVVRVQSTNRFPHVERLDGDLLLRDSPWDPYTELLPMHELVDATLVAHEQVARSITRGLPLDPDAFWPYADTIGGSRWPGDRGGPRRRR